MLRAWVSLTLATAAGACVKGAPATDGPLGSIDGPLGSIDGAYDGPHADAHQLPDAAGLPDAHFDAVPADASPPLLLIPTGADLGLVEAGVAGTGSVRFDNDSGADVIITTAWVTGTDYTLIGSTCAGTIPDQGYCTVDVRVIPTAIGARLGQVFVGNAT